VGSTVYLSAGGMKQRQDVLSGGSYGSTSDPRLHFGIGESSSAADIEVHWAGGKVEHFTAPGVDRILTLTEGSGSAAAAPGQSTASR
jgi:enediyne biosynthesis protein E4